jgi:hypothetical protein
VLILGVEYGIVLAIIASVVDHLRHSYSPLNSVLVKSPEGHWHPVPARPGHPHRGGAWWSTGSAPACTTPTPAGSWRTSLALVGHGGPLRWTGHRLRRHRGRGLHRVHGPGQGRRARSPASRAPGAQLRPRPGAAATRPLRHQQGPGSRCLLRHARPGPRGLPLHRALDETLRPGGDEGLHGLGALEGVNGVPHGSGIAQCAGRH